MNTSYSSLSFVQRNVIPLIPGKVESMFSSDAFKKNIDEPAIREHALQEIRARIKFIAIFAICASATIYCGIQTLCADNSWPNKPESSSDIVLKITASVACIATGLTAALLIPVAFKELKLSHKIAHIVTTSNI